MGRASDLEGQSLIEIAEYQADTIDSLGLFFSTLSENNISRYLGFTPTEVNEVLTGRVLETDLRSSLAVLSSLEAAFRIDYLARCQDRLKDGLSRDFRELYKQSDSRVSLEDDILELWGQHHPTLKKRIGEFRGALKFRHWLAHGRYWVPKLGRRYDFADLYLLATIVLGEFPFAHGQDG